MGGILASCAPKDNEVAASSDTGYSLDKYAKQMGNGITVNLGSGEVAILNYAYALEQLEAAFYEMVVANPYEGLGTMMNTSPRTDERRILTDIRDHEVVHREFFKKALGTSAIQGLTPNFSGINFKQRSVVLDVARQFEDLGVAAYNGAGKYLKNPDYLLTAGKIVSVEARHASILADLNFRNETAFAGDTKVNGFGLERSLEPQMVLSMVAPFVQETLTISSLS